MSQAAQSYLFFLKCPDLKKLICFTAEITVTNVETKGLSVFHRRILKCRYDLSITVENCKIMLRIYLYFSQTELSLKIFNSRNS